MFARTKAIGFTGARFNSLLLGAKKIVGQSDQSVTTEVDFANIFQKSRLIGKVYVEFEAAFGFAIDGCLEAVTRQTKASGRLRSSMLDILMIQVRHYMNRTNVLVCDRYVPWGFSKEEMDVQYEKILESRLDQIQQYRFGWTAPIDPSWDERHPNLQKVVLLIFGAILAFLGRAIYSVLFPAI